MDTPAIVYREHTIQFKRDFGRAGYYDARSRSHIRVGFVVVKDGCNAMPGAAWFESIAQARRGIDTLIETGDTPRFWDVWHAREDR